MTTGQHARGYKVTVWADIFDDEVEEFFDRIATAAHMDDQQVICSGGWSES